MIDARFAPVAYGIGTLDEELAPGIYELTLRAGPRVEREILRLVPGMREERDADLRFRSAAPLAGAADVRESHRDAAVAASRELAHAHGADAGGLLIMLRSPGPVWREVGPDSVRALRVLRGDLSSVGEFQARYWTIGSDGWAVRAAAVAPGGHVLRRVQRGGTVDQALWVASGWQTLVFVPQTAVGPATELASIHMWPLHSPWDPMMAAELDSAAELALWGLREGRAVVPPNLLSLLLRAKWSNPMAGIVGARSLLLPGAPSGADLAPIIANLEQLVGAHPDVLSLRLDVPAQQAAVDPVAWPPMLAASFRRLLRAAAESPMAIAGGSVAEQVAGRLVERGPWTAWRRLPDLRPRLSRDDGLGRLTRRAYGAIPDPSQPALATSPEAERVARHLAEVAGSSDRAKVRNAAEQRRPADIAAATALPLTVVEDVLDSLLN